MCRKEYGFCGRGSRVMIDVLLCGIVIVLVNVRVEGLLGKRPQSLMLRLQTYLGRTPLHQVGHLQDFGAPQLYMVHFLVH